MNGIIVRGIYDVTAQTYHITLEIPGAHQLLTPEQCKALEEALYEARIAMPYRLEKKADNPV